MWIISHITFIIFAVEGLFFKVKWCENIFLFFIYLASVATIIVYCDKKSKEKVKNDGWAVPVWLSISVDLIIVGMLAAAGRFFTAVIWFMQMSLEYSIHENKSEKD